MEQLNYNFPNTYPKKYLIYSESQPTTFEETLVHLEKRLKRIRYNQLNFLNSKGKITYNEVDGTYLLSNFYRNSAYPNQGSCGELRSSMFGEIQKNRDTIYREFGTILKCIGMDGGRNGILGEFSGEGSVHNFLIVAKENLNFPKNASTRKIELFNNFYDYFYVIDPSFGRVISFQESGYTIKLIMGENVATKLSDNQILYNYESVPINTDKNGKIWCLANHNKEIYLTSSKPNEPLSRAGIKLNNPEILSFFPNDPIMLHMIKILQKKVAEQTVINDNKPFELNYR